MDTQAFRRSLHHSDRYNRRGFDSPTKRAQALEEAYQSDLITSIRNNSFTYKRGRLNIKLAQAFGFCWGVERAVAMAYETRRHYSNYFKGIENFKPYRQSLVTAEESKEVFNILPTLF